MEKKQIVKGEQKIAQAHDFRRIKFFVAEENFSNYHSRK